MSIQSIKVCFLVLTALVAWSCGDDDSGEQGDGFDRSVMLANWADNNIIPAYTAYVDGLDELVSKNDAFNNEADQAALDALRTAFLDGYTLWQQVSTFEIGQAEADALRTFTNTYPADVDKIESLISAGDYNLTLPSNFDVQGFPALDYLLYGVASTDAEILTTLSGQDYRQYMTDLIERLLTLSSGVLSDWTSSYRTVFVENDGSSASASVDKMVNDLVFYYEKFLRAGKVGIPAGVFSGSPIATGVEAPYSGTHTLELFNTALDAFQDFFNGNHFDSSGSGESLASYLADLQSVQGGSNIADQINAQLDAARAVAQNLNPNFKEQVLNDNSKMLQLYDELQKVVVLLKVDMMQAMNIRVDFVDADGD